MTEISRRKFIQLSVLSGAVAAAGCKTQSKYDDAIYHAEVKGTYGGYDNRVYPYQHQPDGMQDGVPQYFATTCRMCPAGCGLMVRTLSGRAVNVMGNPQHPVSAGKICSRGVASLQHVYNPDRLRFPARRPTRDAKPVPVAWDEAVQSLAQNVAGAAGKLEILADPLLLGPTAQAMLQDFAAKHRARVTTYTLLDDTPWRRAALAVYGRAQIPAYQLDQADVIVSFGGDFLEAWPSPVLYNRLFGEFRQGSRRAQGDHGQLIYVGPRMSMTAAKADQWLPCKAGTEAIVAQGVQAALQGGSVDAAAAASGLTADQITGLAQTLKAAGARAVAVAGNNLLGASDPTAAFTAVEAVNAAVGSRCVGFGTSSLPQSQPVASSLQQVRALADRMNAGQVTALLIVGQPNPIFSLPPALKFGDALRKVSFVGAITPFEDETTAYADLLLPIRTFLEDWGDSVPAVIPAGVRMASIQQPIIDPHFVGGHGQATDHLKPFTPWMDTIPLGHLLAEVAAKTGATLGHTDSLAAVRTAWAGLGAATPAQTELNNDAPWINTLATGGQWTEGAAAPAPARPAASAALSAPAAGNGQFSLVLYPHLYWTDGRHANLPWLQENPDPMTSAVWNNWVEINRQTAKSLDIRTGDIVRISANGRSIDVAAYPSPGIRPDTLAMPIGQGHTAYGRSADLGGHGQNPLSLLGVQADPTTGAFAFGTTAVTIQKVRSAKSGYDYDLNTLVLVQDRPDGATPEAVKNLTHETAKEWKYSRPVVGSPEGAAGSEANQQTTGA